MGAFTAAIQEIDAKIEKLQSAREQLVELNGGTTTSIYQPPTSRRGRPPAEAGTPRRQMSEESKARIREAQQRRWAAVRGEGSVAPSPAPPISAGVQGSEGEPTKPEVEAEHQVETHQADAASASAGPLTVGSGYTGAVKKKSPTKKKK